MSPEGSCGTEDILKPSQAYISLAPKGAERHCNATRDVQDILPGTASPRKATGRSVRRRRTGPKRKNWMPNPFGKYPDKSSVKKYVEATRHWYAASSNQERTRKLRSAIRMLRQLGAPPSPKDVKPEHIMALLDELERKGLEGATRRKLLGHVRDYLAYYGNDVVTTMKARKQIKLPREGGKEVRHLPADAIDRIHNTALTMEGWRGSIARFLTLVYPYTGLRPSELRKIEFRDLDLARWTMMVRHPKGERSYGRQRSVGILPAIREQFANFLEERRDYLASIGQPENVAPLIPHNSWTGLTFCPEQKFRNIKVELERKSGIRFKLKDYRATFCQMAIDNGAPLQAVSKVMGHKTTQTTEQYYGRMRDEPAIAEIEKALMKPSAETVKTLE